MSVKLRAWRAELFSLTYLEVVTKIKFINKKLF